ncbi:MAG: SDR family oxidoreductase [Thermoanaerobaculia bacterium]|nr:SDR family oxidoreductase [Thermoanaerobaculia bacterium]
MDLELSGKSAVVTGASRGIGRAIALGLAREGVDLTVCARGEADLREAAEEMEGEGVEVEALAVDMTEPDAGGRLVEVALARFGRLDVVVNNVGGNRRGDFDELGDQDWLDLLELNFLSHVRTARAAIPQMKRQESGVVLFVSSIFGREAGGAGLSLYNTTKSALISTAKIMALELAPHGIRVNSIAPGSIRHPGGSWDRRVEEDPEGMRQFVADNLPIGRFGTAEEVADVVTFVASERASLVVGACVNVDGGQSRSLI